MRPDRLHPSETTKLTCRPPSHLPTVRPDCAEERRSAEEELRRLADVYARTMDDRDTSTLISLFAPGGRVIIAAERTREFVAPDGLTQIIDYMSRYAHTFYFVGNHICTVDGDRATGETYSIAYHHRTSPGRPGLIIETPIRYLDEYVRLPDGWRFQQRSARILWTATRAVSGDDGA
jgi:hypothetical protein